jgi:hypothetical protein
VDEALSKGEAPMATEGQGGGAGQASQVAPAAQPAGSSSAAVTHAGMNAAVGNGHAVRLGPGLCWVARYDGSWWVECEHGWLRVTDEGVARDLDQLAARLADGGSVAEDAPSKEPG